MDKFAFIIHPLKLNDFNRKFNWADKIPDKILKGITRILPPFEVSHITGIESLTDRRVEGYFVACPLTSEQMMKLPEEEVLNKIIKAGEKAESLGVDIIGLGAFTSVVGDKGITVAKNLNTPVTTGNTYTVATAIEGTEMAADKMDLDIEDETISVVGATGSIGRTVSILMAERTNHLILVARNKEKLKILQQELSENKPGIKIEVTNNVNDALSVSRIIISASGAVNSLIDPNKLLSGSVVCDVARPRDVASRVGNKRNDIMVIEGGVVRLPGDVNFNFNFGYPPGTSYACMAETILLTLERNFTNYTLGSKVEVNKVKEMWELAGKHGFEVIDLRGDYTTDLSEETICSMI